MLKDFNYSVIGQLFGIKIMTLIVKDCKKIYIKMLLPVPTLFTLLFLNVYFIQNAGKQTFYPLNFKVNSCRKKNDIIFLNTAYFKNSES